MSTTIQTKQLVSIAKRNAREMQKEASRMRNAIDIQLKTLQEMEKRVEQMKEKPARLDNEYLNRFE